MLLPYDVHKAKSTSNDVLFAFPVTWWQRHQRRGLT